MISARGDLGLKCSQIDGCSPLVKVSFDLEKICMYTFIKVSSLYSKRRFFSRVDWGR